MTDDAELEALLRGAGARGAPPDDVAARVRAATFAAWQASNAARPRRLRWLAAAAAALVLLVGSWVAVRQQGNEGAAVAAAPFATLRAGELFADAAPTPLGVGAGVAAGTTLRTGATRGAALRLTGGTDLRLAAGTRVRIESPTSLRVLAGAVYADAAAAPSPLQVVCGDVRVRDIGTQFAVRPVGTGAEVRLREGSVEVTSGALQRTYAARGRDGVRVVAGAGQLRATALARDAQAWRWTRDVGAGFDVRDASVGTFLAWAARELGLELRYASDAVREQAARTRLAGDVSGLPAEEALDVVLGTTSLVERMADGTLYVDRAAGGE